MEGASRYFKKENPEDKDAEEKMKRPRTLGSAQRDWPLGRKDQVKQTKSTPVCESNSSFEFLRLEVAGSRSYSCAEFVRKEERKKKQRTVYPAGKVVE